MDKDKVRELIERSQEGDRDAFDQLTTEYYIRVYQTATTLIDDPIEVEDVVQETFMKAWVAIGKFRGDSDIFTWLYRIVTNNAKNRLLSKKNKMIRYGCNIYEVEEDDENNANLTIAESPEEEYFGKELEELIYDAIEDLPEELKEAITLREFHYLSYSEISITLGVAVGTVRSRIFRARQTINDNIKPYTWREK